jgi:hypothetical protein
MARAPDPTPEPQGEITELLEAYSNGERDALDRLLPLALLLELPPVADERRNVQTCQQGEDRRHGCEPRVVSEARNRGP